MEDEHNTQVKGMGSVQLKLHSVVIRTFYNMRYMLEVRVNLISLRELTTRVVGMLVLENGAIYYIVLASG